MICEVCGLPRGVGRANRWMAGGYISGTRSPELRGVFSDAQEVGYWIGALSESMGYDITHLVVEGKRQDSKRYASKLLKGMMEKGMEPPPPGSFFQMMAATYAVPGFGLIRLAEVDDSEGVTLEAEEVYSLPMFLGQAAGVFEAALGRRGELEWEGRVNSGTLRIRAVEEETEQARRLETEVQAPNPLVEVEGEEPQACAGCGAPVMLSAEFDWDIGKARITEKRSGRRFVFDDIAGTDAVMRVLRTELGEDVDRLLLQISRRYAADYYSSLPSPGTPEEELARFSLMGWGRADLLGRAERGKELRLLNPYCFPLVAGRAWGLMETLSGHPFEMAWERREEGDFLLLLS